MLVTTRPGAQLDSTLCSAARPPSVPTSVGYGVAEGGRAALHSVLSSCAPGLVVTNIDNGYGAACAAMRILSRG